MGFILGYFTFLCLFVSFHLFTDRNIEGLYDSGDKEIVFDGSHILRKMQEEKGFNFRTSASSFLLFSKTETSLKTSTKVTFAWKMNNGTYAISTLPIEKLRVRFYDKIETPIISFGLNNRGFSKVDLQYLMDNIVSYAILTIKEEDWPSQVHLPLNTL